MKKENQLKKNILDLKFQDRLSRSNIFLGSIIPLAIGIISLGGVNSAISVKITLVSYSSVILLQLAQKEREKARNKISAIEGI